MSKEESAKRLNQELVAGSGVVKLRPYAGQGNISSITVTIEEDDLLPDENGVYHLGNTADLLGKKIHSIVRVQRPLTGPENLSATHEFVSGLGPDEEPKQVQKHKITSNDYTRINFRARFILKA